MRKKPLYYNTDIEYRLRKTKGYRGWNTSIKYPQYPLAVFQLLSFTYVPQPCKMIDIGCGGGESAIVFAKLGFKVTGIDISPIAIKMAERNAKKAGVKINFMKADVVNLRKIKNSSFDFVFSNAVLHCLTVSKDRKVFYSEIRRILKDKGCVFLTSMYGSPSAALKKRMSVEKKEGKKVLRIWLSLDKIFSEVKAAGFKVLEKEEFTHYYPDGEISKDIAILLKK